MFGVEETEYALGKRISSTDRAASGYFIVCIIIVDLLIS
jgi:hypothetical protein